MKIDHDARKDKLLDRAEELMRQLLTGKPFESLHLTLWLLDYAAFRGETNSTRKPVIPKG